MPIVDPLADTLVRLGGAEAARGNAGDTANEAAGRATGEAAGGVDAFLALDAVFAPLSADERFVAALRRADAALGDASPAAVAAALAADGRA